MIKAADDFDFIGKRLREIEAEKQRERERVDVAQKMSEAAKAPHIDDGMYCVGLADIEAAAKHLRECQWRKMSEESNAWQAEWLEMHRDGVVWLMRGSNVA